MRAIAVLLVIFSHAGFENYVPGGLGVIIFFVLSGFLLTRQMIAEIENTKTLNLKEFYARRFLRLTPALFLYLIVVGGILIMWGSQITFTQIMSAVFYFANYYHIFVGYPAHSPMPILWSLSVEEHFYILFPFLLLGFRNHPPKALPWLIGLVCAVLAWRYSLYLSCAQESSLLCGLPDKERYFGTDAIFDCILYGCIMAVGVRYREHIIKKFLINQTAFIAAALLLIVSLAYRDELFRQTLKFTVQSVAVAVLMLNVLNGNAPYTERLLSHKAMLYVGRLSYSLYLFHYGALALINSYTGREAKGLDGPISLIGYFILTFMLAAVSYHLVEKPILNARHRFGSHAKA